MDFSELPSDAERIIQCVDDLKKKLLPVEAQRISRIWENCISQIEIVATLPANLHSASSEMDEELMKKLKKHQLSCQRLERDTQEGLEQESEGAATKGARSRLEKDIQSSVRDVLRFLRSHPDTIFDLREVQSTEVGESENKLIRELKGFHSHMLNKLLTSPFEESQSTLQNLVTTPLQQVLHDVEHMSSLEADTAKAINHIDIKISQKNAEIENLRQQFSMLSVTDEMYQHNHHTSEKKANMQKQIDHLKIQLNISKQENTEALVILHKENENVEKILDLRQTFDNDVEEKEATIQLEKNHHKRETLELGMQDTLQQQLVSQLKDKKDRLQSNSLEKQASIQQRIDQLDIQLDKLKQENAEGEMQLKKKNEEVEKIKRGLRQTFDKDHEEKQGTLEMEELDNEKELTKLKKLENAFSVIEGEYNQIQERLAEEQRQRELLKIRIRAVVIAQAWWRGYKARKALKNKEETDVGDAKGKKKGGKKGGKKGKSKKKK